MRLWYLAHRRPAKAQASLCIGAALPEPSLFAHINYGRRVRPKKQTSSPTCMAVHAYLKNEFTEDKKCQNLMRWLIFHFTVSYGDVLIVIAPLLARQFHWGLYIHSVRTAAVAPHCGDNKILIHNLAPLSPTLPSRWGGAMVTNASA